MTSDTDMAQPMNEFRKSLTYKAPIYSAILCLFFITSCGEKDGASSSVDIVAMVDGVAISKQQLASAIDAIGPVSAEQRVALSSRVLERIIDQTLIAKKAVKEKLDQDATVAASLENARIQVLSHHYVGRIVEEKAAPSAEEVKKYFASNPYLFEKRRVFRIQEFVAKVNDGQLRILQAELGKSRNLNDAAKWMKSQNIPFTGDIVLRAAEQLPTEDLPRIYGMKIGDIAVIPRGDRVMVFQIVAIQEAPVSEADSAPLIERILVNQRRSETETEESRKLRAGVKIEYLGGSTKAPSNP